MNCRSLLSVLCRIEPTSLNITRCINLKTWNRRDNLRSKRDTINHRRPDFHRYTIVGHDPQNKGMTPLPVHKSGGRGPDGRVWVHGIGGGHKMWYRQVDFNRRGPPGAGVYTERVDRVMKDTFRTADIAVVASGEKKRYIVATENMKAGDLIRSSSEIPRMAVKAEEGDAHPVGALPVGTIIHNIELYPEGGGRICRAAGTCGVLVRKVGDRCVVKMPSKREMNVSQHCMATVGRVSNVDHQDEQLGSPQMSRWLGIRPQSGWWHRKTGYNGRKIRPIPPMKVYNASPPPSDSMFRHTT